MSTIKINDKWNMNYDGVQYSPERYEESKLILGGVNKGKMSKGDMTLTEFLVEYKASADELSVLVKQAIEGVE